MAAHTAGGATRRTATYLSARLPYMRPPGRPGAQPGPLDADWSSPSRAPMGHVDGPVPHDPVAADLRNQVVDRLRRMSVLHARHGWERRNRDPVGPHGLAFFYSEPLAGDPRRRGEQRAVLRTATRMFLDGPEVESLPRLLYDLIGIAEDYRREGGFDPRALMADRVEPMSRHAHYIGVGVSTLDTPAGDWAQIRQSANGELAVAGRCLALLADGTMLLLDRGGERQFGALHIWSTHSLDVEPGQPWRTWRWAHHLPELHDPSTRDVWHWLGQLHLRVRRGSHER